VLVLVGLAALGVLTIARSELADWHRRRAASVAGEAARATGEALGGTAAPLVDPDRGDRG
jgi:hypothetical protein